jgi:predicted DNA-binding protein
MAKDPKSKTNTVGTKVNDRILNKLKARANKKKRKVSYIVNEILEKEFEESVK